MTSAFEFSVLLHLQRRHVTVSHSFPSFAFPLILSFFSPFLSASLFFFFHSYSIPRTKLTWRKHLCKLRERRRSVGEHEVFSSPSIGYLCNLSDLRGEIVVSYAFNSECIRYSLDLIIQSCTKRNHKPIMCNSWVTLRVKIFCLAECDYFHANLWLSTGKNSRPFSLIELFFLNAKSLETEHWKSSFLKYDFGSASSLGEKICFFLLLFLKINANST